MKFNSAMTHVSDECADEKYYRGWSSSGTIKCKDGSRKFSKSQFNDDFCDCPDGSDEPGIFPLTS